MRHNIDAAGLIARILGPLTHSTTDAIRWLRLEIDMAPAASADPEQDLLAPTAPAGVSAMTTPLSTLIPTLIPTPAPRRWERVSAPPPAPPSIIVRQAAGQLDFGMASEPPEQAPHPRETAGHESNAGLIAPSGSVSGLNVSHATPTSTSGSAAMPLVAAVRETSQSADAMPATRTLATAPRQMPAMTAAPASAMTPVPLSATPAAPPQAPADSTAFAAWPTSSNGSVAMADSIENRPAAPIWARKNFTPANNPQLSATATPVFAAISPAHPSPLASAPTDVKPSPSSTAAPQNPAPASSIVLRAPTVPTMQAHERLQQQIHDSGVLTTSAKSAALNTSSESPLHENVTLDASALRAQSLAQPMMQDAGHGAMIAAAPMHGGAPLRTQHFGSVNNIPPAPHPMQPAASHPADALNRLMQAQPPGVRMVARRLEQAMTPVFDRAHAAVEPPISINAGLGADYAPPLLADGSGNAGSFPSSQVKNTFNVNVSLAGGERYGPAELEQMRDALMQVLGEAARRHGLDV